MTPSAPWTAYALLQAGVGLLAVVAVLFAVAWLRDRRGGGS